LPFLRIARPFVADAQPPGHRALTVDDEEFAVIAAERFDRAAGPDRPERADVDAIAAQLAPESAAGAAGAEGIVQDVHADPGARPLRPRARETAPGVIVLNDVILEMNSALRARDHFEHHVEGDTAHRDVADEVAGNRSSTRRAIQRPRERVGRRNGGGHPPSPSDGSTGRSA